MGCRWFAYSPADASAAILSLNSEWLICLSGSVLSQFSWERGHSVDVVVVLYEKNFMYEG